MSERDKQMKEGSEEKENEMTKTESEQKWTESHSKQDDEIWLDEMKDKQNMKLWNMKWMW